MINYMSKIDKCFYIAQHYYYTIYYLNVYDQLFSHIVYFKIKKPSVSLFCIVSLLKLLLIKKYTRTILYVSSSVVSTFW